MLPHLIADPPFHEEGAYSFSRHRVSSVLLSLVRRCRLPDKGRKSHDPTGAVEQSADEAFAPGKDLFL
jgi:hypothetical protein